MSAGNPFDASLPRPRSDTVLHAAMPSPVPARWGLPAEASAAARMMALLAGALLGFVLPVLMVVANKSAPASLGAAALLANAAALLGGRGRALAGRYRALLLSPMTAIAGGVVLLAVASLVWTVDRGLTVRGLVEGLPELVFALGTAAAWRLVADRRDARWLTAGILVAGLLMLFEHVGGMPIHALFRARGEAWDLKRSAVPPLLLLWPAIAMCWARHRRRMAAALLAAVLIGIAASHSGAPAAALVCGLLLFGIALAAPRLSLGLMAAGLALLIVTAPWTGSTLSRVLPAEAAETLREEHAEHRLTIWNAFEKRGFDRPLLGHGFDASFKVAEAPRPGGAPKPADSARIVGFHPHDILLQFWVEFGALGLAAAAVVCCFVLGRLAPLRGASLAARLGLFVAVIGVGLVGLSAWQPWWLASIAAALLWFDFGERLQAE